MAILLEHNTTEYLAVSHPLHIVLSMKQNNHLRLVNNTQEPVREATGPELGKLTIDCNRCVMQHTNACDDCVVSYIVGQDANEPIVLDFNERRACEILKDVGLVPTNRFSERLNAV